MFCTFLLKTFVKHFPVIQQPAVVQLLDFLEVFLCLFHFGYHLCSYHRADFHFSPVIHPLWNFFGFNFTHQLLICFIPPNISAPSSPQKGKIEPWEILSQREKKVSIESIYHAEDERIYEKYSEIFNFKCFGEKISKVGQARATWTMVTNWR